MRFKFDPLGAQAWFDKACNPHKYETDWEEWFAWRPIVIDYDDKDGRLIYTWLKTVKRRRQYTTVFGLNWEYEE